MQDRIILLVIGLVVAIGLLAVLKSGGLGIEGTDSALIQSNPDSTATTQVPSTAKTNEDHNALSRSIRNQTESSPVSADAAVVFPNGERITFKIHPQPGIALAFTSLSQDYDTLKAAAETGNAEAAWLLSSALQVCKNNAFKTSAELNAAIEQLHQTHMLALPNDDEPARLMTNNPDEVEVSLRKTFKDCQGITNAQIQEANDWLVMSSELGHPYALVEFARAHPDDPKFLPYSEAVWLAGHLDGLVLLANHYLPQLDPVTGETQGDAMTSYAYYYIYTQIAPHFIFNEVWIDNINQELSRRATTLRPREIDRAMEIASATLKSNNHCCAL